MKPTILGILCFYCAAHLPEVWMSLVQCVAGFVLIVTGITALEAKLDKEGGNEK